METLQVIRNNDTYKQVLKDSMGGILYNVANRNKYDSKELLKLWDSLSEQEKNVAGGIMQGAINFLKGN